MAENRKKILNVKIHRLLDERKYDEASALLQSELVGFTSSNSIDYGWLTEITGSYISLGMESGSRSATEQGLKLLVEREADLLTAATASSLNYFMGNAKSNLYRHYITENPPYRLPTPEISSKHLFEAKNAFLRAYKTVNLKKLDTFSRAVLTNLAGNLDKTGRIVEALQIFDTVLNNLPEHPQSLVSKAETLVHMVRTTKFHKSISFYATIYCLYSDGERRLTPPADVQERVNMGKEATLKIIKQYGYDVDKVESEYILNQSEFESHPATTRFFLTNFLSLSEHGLFCKCNGAKTDDLAIGFLGLVTSDKKLMRLEALVNRLKSEFSFARQLYYNYSKKSLKDNVHYHNMMEGATYGLDIENLRNSFRMCFGILDKIAQGILYLFDLPKTDRNGWTENIYFESFWEKNSERWLQINSLDNIHLTALYSIASDLSRQGGEFNFYKRWRNMLEHGVFTIRNNEVDQHKILEDDLFSSFTTERDFAIKTLHVLQLTRAAMFSFVFCARNELVNEQTQ